MNTIVQYLEESDPIFVKSVMKLVAGIGFFIGLLVLIMFLPGAEHVIPSVPLTIGSVLIGIGTIAFVGILILLAPRFESIVVRTVNDNALAPPLGSIGRYLIIFGAVIIAHRGLAPALIPFLESIGFASVYDIAFLLAGLYPVAKVTYHMYRTLDPLAGFIAHSLTGATPQRSKSASSSPAPVRGRFDVKRWLHLLHTIDLPIPSLRGKWGVTSQTGPEDEPNQHLQPVQPTSSKPTELINHVPPEFLSNEDRVLSLLESHGGRMQQSEVVAETEWSKSKVSRVLSKMEQDEQIIRVDVGRGNIVTRPDDLPSGAKSLINK